MSDAARAGRPDVACPGCGYVPTAGDRWMCAPDGCGALWDTFETGARCPDCGAKFVWTACPGCHRAFRHQSWYRNT